MTTKMMLGRAIAYIRAHDKLHIILLIVLVSFIPRIVTVNDVPPQYDEEWKVSMGFESTNLLLRGDFSNPFWTEVARYCDYHPPFFGYLSSFVILLQAMLRGETISTVQSGSLIFGLFPALVDYTTRRPAVRIMNVVVSVLMSILLYLFCFELTKDRKSSFAASVLYSFNPFSLIYSRVATDGTLAEFFITLSIFCFYLGTKSNPFKRRYLVYSSLLFGLAISTKFLAVVVPLTLCLWLLFDFRHRRLKMILPMVALFLGGLLVFFAVWPFLWTGSQALLEIFLFFVRWTNLPLSFGYPRYLDVYPSRSSFMDPKYLTYLFIRTPLPELAFLLLGLALLTSRIFLNKSRERWESLILIWFAVSICLLQFVWVVHLAVYYPLILPCTSLLVGLSLQRFITQRVKNHQNLVVAVILLIDIASVLWFCPLFNYRIGGTWLGGPLDSFPPWSPLKT